tara:strand:- start:278 stop:793 length:516 start_codon:yes stop_codon:yes gene_type:complete
MIITCTECKKQFVVPDNAIPAEGRTVQCSSCSNEWKQLPLKKSGIVKKKTPPSTIRKIAKKSKGPIPYSKEYMQQKWGASVQSYAVDKGLSKKIPRPKKPQKQKSIQVAEKPGFGFFSYIITLSIFAIAIIGVVDLAKNIIVSRLPFLEPYIEHFFETINNFKIFILDLYR